MPLDRKVGIVFEQADAGQMGMDSLSGIKGAVQKGTIARAVIARNGLESIRAKTIVGIEVRRARLDGVVTGVVGQGLVQAELVEEPLALVADIVQGHARVAGEADIKAKVHPLDILLLGVDGEAVAGGGDRGRGVQHVHGQDGALLVGPGPVPLDIGPVLDKPFAPVGGTELFGRLVKDTIVQPALELPLAGITAGDVGLEEEAEGQQRLGVELVAGVVPEGIPPDDPAIILPQGVDSPDVQCIIVQAEGGAVPEIQCDIGNARTDGVDPVRVQGIITIGIEVLYLALVLLGQGISEWGPRDGGVINRNGADDNILVVWLVCGTHVQDNLGPLGRGC